ncbi:MAG TPA: ABC transporter ATP-binding protein [Candidatus Atribacteria bacterium]|nr:ABC transporter ATP-binding protein [Candidatus Atribacteria bacterium]
MAILKVKNLNKHFGKVKAVQEVSFEAPEGKVLSLLGPSGCGKTTSLRCIAGFENPDSGEIYLDDRKITHIPPEKRGIGMVFQNYALWPHMTVYGNLAFGLQIRKVPKNEIIKKIKRVLGMVQLEGYENRFPRQMSGGQQQRIAMARALVFEPEIMLLDEPLSNLDAQLREEMRFEFTELQKKLGITAIYVTHDQAEALVISDKIVILNQGKIVQSGTPKEIFSHPRNKFVAGFIAVTSFMDGKVDSFAEEKKKIIIKTDDGLTIQGNNNHFSIEQRVSVAIRMNAVDFIKDEDEIAKNSINLFKGKIIQSSYLGNIVDYKISTGNWIVRTNSEVKTNFKVGDEVTFYLPPEKIIVTSEK